MSKLDEIEANINRMPTAASIFGVSLAAGAIAGVAILVVFFY